MGKVFQGTLDADNLPGPLWAMLFIITGQTSHLNLGDCNMASVSLGLV